MTSHLRFYPLSACSELRSLPYNGCLFHKLLLKLTAWIAVLKTLGAWGLLLSATIDSLAIPIPVDAIVASYAYSVPHKAWLYCAAAAVGSAIGSLLPYGLGRAGGELFLLKRIDEQRLKRIRDRFERQEFLALMVPAILPPPTPFKLFVFSAGVFEMKVLHFLLAIACGRLIRYGILSVLTVIFGPQIVTEATSLFRKHPLVLVLVLIGVIVGIFVIFWLLRAPAAEVATELRRHDQDTDDSHDRPS
jgi:membrane protein YqaA with SNARE-associated domain